MVETTLTKIDLANELADYSRKEQREILRAARCLRRYLKLTEVEQSAEEEADELIEAFGKKEK
jgi:hypothetical protein